MECIMKIMIMSKCTLFYFKKKLICIVSLENGLLTLKMNNFPPLLLALLGGIYPTSPTKPTGTDLPRRPGTPALPRRPTPSPFTEEERNRSRRKALALPAGHQRDDDDDEEGNKENQPPDQRRENEEVTLYQLLKKLEDIIEQFLQRVSRDLHDFRQKLGTLNSS
uniref:E4 protein n=1 Tax=Human papillomavirus TaxID=10566 RepID=A0A385PIN0_9PAPI|nr:MAG: E4 protein [Human papillomavirus]